MRIPDDYLAIAEDGTAAELFQALDRMAGHTSPDTPTP